MNMSDENNTQQGGGEVLPAATPAPKSDAEAALQAAPPAEPTAEEKAAKAETERKAAEEGERKKNRTRDYINRINRENAELRQQAAELAARQQPQQSRPTHQQHQPPADQGPTLADYNYDLTAFQQARDQWVIEQAEKRWTASQQKQATTAREQETWATYESRAAEFADANPDFLEVVSSIAYPITDAAQAAIAAHENGPAIAYHLGNNEDDAYELARTPPHLADAAVRRLASRLGAAPPPQVTPAAAPAPVQKTLSQAPPPVPTVSGRSATEVPAEKLTDDDWYAKDRERRRKR
jgi:hypothetical protein